MIEHNKCRVCGTRNLATGVDLGDQYLSSVFPGSMEYKDTLKKYPLKLVLCKKEGHEKNCGLLQLSHEIDMSDMYRNYPYLSSSNKAMVSALKDVVDEALLIKPLKDGDVVVDIGCNDGSLLSFLSGRKLNLIGVDGAENLVPVFEDPGFRFVRGFFKDGLFSEKADLVFSIAMFYHLSDPIKVCMDVCKNMKDDGIWVIQMAYLPAMLDGNMYDNIVHEHNTYYSLETLRWVMRACGLEIFNVSFNNVYGGSFRAFIKKKGCSRYPVNSSVYECIYRERELDLFSLRAYTDFDGRIKQSSFELCSLLHDIKRVGSAVWVYGASTKGNTILQYCGIGAGQITAAADANPFKIGKFLIGSDIPIKDEKDMRQSKPDYLLVLPYGFVQDFIKRESGFLPLTKMIVPLPKVDVLEMTNGKI